MKTWVIFKLIERPMYDRHGEILSSVADKRNRYGIDEFYGSGWVFPDIHIPIQQWHDGDQYLVLVDLMDVEVFLDRSDSKIEPISQRVSEYSKTTSKVLRVSFKDFKPRVLTQEEAEDFVRTRFRDFLTTIATDK